jgi:hypothetical protein
MLGSWRPGFYGFTGHWPSHVVRCSIDESARVNFDTFFILWTMAKEAGQIVM